MCLPLPDVHITTLESADGTMPDDISTNTRSTGHDSIVINSDRTCPACLALIVLVLGMVFQLDRTRASTGKRMVRSRAGVTRRTPKRGCRCVYMYMICGKVGMGNGVCRCRCIEHGGWGALERELILVRAATRRWSGALLVLLLRRWRWRRRRRRQGLPHRVRERAYLWGGWWTTACRCMDGVR